MDVFMLVLSIVIFLIMWFLCGFIGFLIGAKRDGIIEFNPSVREECIVCVLAGVLTLIIMIFWTIKDWFISFMNRLLWKMNHKK